MKTYKNEIILVSILLFLDQLTKYLIMSKFILGQTVVLLPFFQLTYITNTGVSFGMFSGGNKLFALFTAVVLAGFIFWYIKNKATLTRWLKLALIMIISGAAGNLIDRIVHGAVIDFLEFHYKNHYFPVFNIADSCISAGGVILFISVLHSEFKRK